MYNLDDFYAILDRHAPIVLSEKCKQNGDYDNSGILVKQTKSINSVLFTLDLSSEAVKKAKRLGCDTIVTHHPAIYMPVAKLDCEGETKALLDAIKLGLNVISMHLNLDMAKNGIDYYLAEAFDAKNYKILEPLTDSEGYGREFSVSGKTLLDLKRLAVKNLKTKRVITYGNLKGEVKKCATFCGSGSGSVSKLLDENKIDADLIITSDMPHHVIKKVVENGKKLILLPHYSAENYGFYKYFTVISKEVLGGVKTYYFEDKRFM